MPEQPPSGTPGSRLIAVPRDGRAHRILLVEDDADTREMLALALRGQGYEVAEAAGAEAGLDLLRQSAYDLVVAHYNMPGKTAAAMLRQAMAEDLLKGAATLVVTAHPEPLDVDPSAVVRKPFDLTKFLVQVQKLFAPSAGAGPAEASDLVRLVLYISPGSPTSLRALRNYERLATEYDPDTVDWDVCDVSLKPQQAEQDQVVFTPTLVKRAPEPTVWILGDLSEPDIVRSLLDASGARRRGSR